MEAAFLEMVPSGVRWEGGAAGSSQGEKLPTEAGGAVQQNGKVAWKELSGSGEHIESG